jgi:hypothetical protein
MQPAPEHRLCPAMTSSFCCYCCCCSLCISPVLTKMSVHKAQVNFINASRFAVIGRTLSDREKWDNKVCLFPLGGSGEGLMNRYYAGKSL